MGRAPVLIRAGGVLLVLALLAPGPLAVEGGDAPFAVRILGVPGPAGDPRVDSHVEFGIACGFNALWVTTRVRADRELEPAFLDRLAAWRARGLRLFVEILAAEGEGRVAGRNAERALARFVTTLARRTGTQDIVVSFDGASLTLSDLADVDRYGPDAAPAHLDLLRAVEKAVPRDVRVWLRPAVSSDRGLDDPRLPYSAALLSGMERIPRRVGVVWSGTAPVSVTLDARAIRAARARFGGRPMILADRFPANGSGARIPLALVLGPLRGRSPDLAAELAGYLSIPMAELGGSRLSLLTVADYLRDPDGYDPDRSERAAIERLAGSDPAAREALDTQAIEWGGWVGSRNYHTADTSTPQTAADSLSDPARLSSWTWTVRRYPERMAALAGAADRVFTEDLLRTMARRLAVARAAPVVAELLARRAAGRGDLAGLRKQIDDERARLADRRDVREALDRFLLHAGISLAPVREGDDLAPVSETVP